MNEFEITISIIGGIVGLFAGAESLVRGSSSLALRLGISPLVVGLTVVAFATSSPELVVSIKAALEGNPGIVVGNVVGSNICNIGLILGVAALISPIRIKTQLIKREIPIMILVGFILLLVLADDSISRLEGVLLILGITSYVIFSYLYARKDKVIETSREFIEAIPKGKEKSGWISILLIVGGLGLLLGGAHIFVNGAVEVAVRLGVSQAIIGLSMVALGTSLPELMTSIVASFRNENDIAIGNAVGSNVFNVLSVLGFSSVISPISSSGVGYIDLTVMMLFMIVILPMSKSGFVLKRFEGAILLAGYFAYILYLAL
ncbi:MAG: calcium/sodium antiporter [Ignavibacteriaceae bacterium]